MLGRNSFFKTNKPRRFNYQPLYWDPEKEEQEKAARWRESGEDDKLSLYFTRELKDKQARRTNNMRIVIIVLLILILFIFFW